jgi:hypothetical protein
MDVQRRVSRVLRRAACGLVRSTHAAAGLLPQRGRASPALTVTDYKAPNYWLGYRSGFVRRGLPGALLRLVAGGSPTYRQMEVAAAGLSRAAALSVVAIAMRAARHVPPGLPRVVATGLMVSSPLTCSLLLHDVGRYDGVGVLVLAGLAAAGPAMRRLPVPVGAVLLAAAVTVATASEEFLLAVVAPAAWAAAVQLSGARELSLGRRLLLGGAILGPGAVVAAASMVVPPPPGALSAVREEATQAGVGPAGAMGDALAALDRGLVENLAFFRLFHPAAVVLALALWTGLYLVTTAVLGGLLGRAGSGGYRALAGVHAAVGAALCAVGADFRRWWGLAFLGLVATIAAREPDGQEGPVAPGDVTRAAALALAGLALRDMRVYPGGRVRLDRVFPVVRTT